MGFSSMYPFMPLFVQDLGIDDQGCAALWAGAAIGVSGIPAFIFGPIWEVLGDRFGRKKNVLRAIFGTASLLLLIGLSTNVYQLIVFRLIYGMVTGVDAVSTALIAATSPKERIPFGMGVSNHQAPLGIPSGLSLVR